MGSGAPRQECRVHPHAPRHTAGSRRQPLGARAPRGVVHVRKRTAAALACNREATEDSLLVFHDWHMIQGPHTDPMEGVFDPECLDMVAYTVAWVAVWAQMLYRLLYPLE